MTKLHRSILSLVMLATLLVSAVAWGKHLPVHNITSTKPLGVADGGKWYKPTEGGAAISWKGYSTYAFAHARAQLDTGDVYEFQLVAATTNTTPDKVEGKWDVTRNGLVICASCTGSAYGLSGEVGDYFKIYVSGEKYHFSGYITSREDY